jgi:hypothetical protein
MHATFTQALQRGGFVSAEICTRKLSQIVLADALELTALIALHDPQRGKRAPDYRLAGAVQPLGRSEQQVHAADCGEAEAAGRALAATPVAAIWIDGRPANTRSGQRAPNCAALAGFVAVLPSQGSTHVVGVYSRADFCRQITHGRASFTLPESIATSTEPDPPGCPGPVPARPGRLSQNIDRRDLDTTC